MECHVCKKTYSTKYTYKRHLDTSPECKESDVEIGVSFECKKCGKKFKSEFGYNNHISNTCKSLVTEDLEQKNKDLLKEIEDLKIEVKKHKDYIAKLKDKMKIRSSLDLESLRDISELRNFDFVKSRASELISLDKDIIDTKDELVRDVLVPLLAPYVRVADPSRFKIIYRDGDDIYKTGTIHPIVRMLNTAVANRLSYLEEIKRRPVERIFSDHFYTNCSKYCPSLIRYLYKRRDNPSLKDDTI